MWQNKPRSGHIIPFDLKACVSISWLSSSCFCSSSTSTQSGGLKVCFDWTQSEHRAWCVVYKVSALQCQCWCFSLIKVLICVTPIHKVTELCVATVATECQCAIITVCVIFVLYFVLLWKTFWLHKYCTLFSCHYYLHSFSYTSKIFPDSGFSRACSIVWMFIMNMILLYSKSDIAFVLPCCAYMWHHQRAAICMAHTYSDQLHHLCCDTCTCALLRRDALCACVEVV